MSKIIKVYVEVLDSRGNQPSRSKLKPNLVVMLSNGPIWSLNWRNEAVELRDGDKPAI